MDWFLHSTPQKAGQFEVTIHSFRLTFPVSRKHFCAQGTKKNIQCVRKVSSDEILERFREQKQGYKTKGRLFFPAWP